MEKKARKAKNNMARHSSFLIAYPLHTLVAVASVPNVSMMYSSHLCFGFPLLLFPATIPVIIVFSIPLWRVTWPTYVVDALHNHTASSLEDEVHLILKSWDYTSSCSQDFRFQYFTIHYNTITHLKEFQLTS